jgi:putative membrane protein
VRLVVWLLVNAGALGVATLLLDGITLTGDSAGSRVVTLLVVGAIFGAVTAVVKPVLTFLSFPFVLLTLGLLLLVINALMLLLTGRIAASLGLGFHVHGFWTAVAGGVIVAVASMVLAAVLPD